FLAIGPLMYAGALGLEWLYHAIHYEHPQEHDLLAKMREVGNPFVKGLLVLGATILAPLFEEFLFRGHLQTVLVSVLSLKPLGTKTLQAEPQTPTLDYESPPL